MIKFFASFFTAILLMGIYFNIPTYDETLRMVFLSFIGLFIGFLVYQAAK